MRYLAFLFGIFLMGLAVFANQIGIDHNAVWGAGRYQLFYAGLALGVLSLLVHFYKTGILPQKIRQKLAAGKHFFATRVRRISGDLRLSLILGVLLLVGVTAYAAWFTSAGLFPTFEHPSFNPYVDLGEAFLHGQVSLLQKPDPRLVAIQDPVNDYQARLQVPYLFDISYFKGNYYVYWGPVPALVYAALQGVARVRPPDQWGVLLFYAGLGALILILLWRARKGFFPNAPGLSLPLFLLAAMVSLPLIVLLEHSYVYETAVIAGQFFLFLGLAAWLFYLLKPQPAWLALAGLSYGLAIGSRYNVVFSVAVFSAFALWTLWREGGGSRPFLQRAAALLAPMALCGLALALYNAVRFENPLQTGLSYQLTYPWYMNQYFSLAYFPSNLYQYLLSPLTVKDSFPFIVSAHLQATLAPAWALEPVGKYHEEAIFGALPALPVLWLLAALLPLGGVSLARKRRRGTTPVARTVRLRRQLAAMLLLAGLLQLVSLLFYYFSAMRYYADFYLLILLRMVFVAWELDERLRSSGARFARIARLAFWLAAALLVLATSGMGLLAGFDLPPQLFRHTNPALFSTLAAQINQLYAGIVELPDTPGILGIVLRLGMHLAGL